MKLKSSVLGLALGVAAIVGGGLASVATASPETQAKATTPDVGLAAPDFTLSDMNGKSHKLSDLKGKTVVLMWWSPECPFVVKHFSDKSHQTFNTLYTDYNTKNVVFLAINSANPAHSASGADLNKKMVKEWNFQWPVLNDSAGTVGNAYGAKNTPEMFIIDKNGVIAYHGAIDNDPSPKGPGAVNYVRQALDQILAGESVSTAKTKAYGCSVKYAS
jgi:peroxiredoxin